MHAHHLEGFRAFSHRNLQNVAQAASLCLMKSQPRTDRNERGTSRWD